MLFFFKQKTAYELRISDWSSDVCSSDLTTHVVEFAPRLMAVQVDDGGGRLLRRKIEALGVTVHTQKSTSEIVDGDPSNGGARHKMKFADGSELETDMIVFSAGKIGRAHV